MRRTSVLVGVALVAAITFLAGRTCAPPPHADVPAPAPTVGATEPAPPAPRRATPRASPPAADEVPETPPPAAASAADASPVPPRTITIRVVPALNASLKDVRVRAWGMRYQPVLEFEALRAADGAAREVAPGPDGVATFTVAAGLPRAIAYATATGVHTMGVVLELDETLEGTIALGGCASVEGTVLDADGRPVADAAVQLIPLDRPASGRAGGNTKLWAEPGVFEFYVTTVRTDAAGRYRMPGVPTPPLSGAVRRVAIAQDAAGKWWRGGEFFAEEAGQSCTADVRLGATQYVAEPAPVAIALRARGVVIDAESKQPRAGASIALVVPTPCDWSRRTQARSGDDGRFDVVVLWDGRGARDDVRLRVRASEFDPWTGPVGDASVVVALGRGTCVTLPGRVAGRITGPEGGPVAGIHQLTLTDDFDDGETYSVAADADGMFVLDGLAPGGWEANHELAAPVAFVLAPGGEERIEIRLREMPVAPVAWTEADESAWRIADAEWIEAASELSADTDEPDAEARERRTAAELRFHETLERKRALDARRRRSVPRIEVTVRGLAAAGPSWLVAELDDERWTAPVRNGEARFATLAPGAWSFELRGGAASELEQEFGLVVPPGRTPVTLDAPAR